jgi:hypothetical protein
MIKYYLYGVNRDYFASGISQGLSQLPIFYFQTISQRTSLHSCSGYQYHSNSQVEAHDEI